MVPVAMRPGERFPVLATQALPPATSTLTGRLPTRMVSTTCGPRTCGLPPGGVAGADAFVVAGAGGRPAPPLAKSTAAPAPTAAPHDRTPSQSAGRGAARRTTSPPWRHCAGRRAATRLAGDDRMPGGGDRGGAELSRGRLALLGPFRQRAPHDVVEARRHVIDEA